MPDLFAADQAEARRGGGFRWFFSTCLAAAVGAVAIAAVIFGSLDISGGPGRFAASLRQATLNAARPSRPAPDRPVDGLAWAVPKSDRLEATMDAVSTRYVVQDTIRERRASREYLLKKPHARVVIRLAAVEPDPSVVVPPFNPLKLFAGSSPREAGGPATASSAPDGGEVALRVVEILGSILPTDDGQELENGEALELVRRLVMGEADRAQIRPSFAPEGLDLARRGSASAGAVPFTTVLHRSQVEADDLAEEAEGQRVRVKLARGETLTRLLTRMGAEPWLARDMVEAARGVLPEAQVTAGHDIEVTLVPSLSGASRNEPTRYTVLGPGGEHRVTVERNPAGEFVASAAPTPTAPSVAPSGAGRGLSAYNSLYHGALAQGISPDAVHTILRLHAYEADFRRRVRGSDQVELFFDLKDDDKGADGALGELLMSSISIGGLVQRFYRFKEPDGTVDFYDANGNNSRRFLLRKPLRGDDVRLTSGFGIRFHPLLNQRKLHAGVDWAGPIGTPIIAAGNGTIEEAGYKGQYGNYVRIRHANSYQTTYGHMRSIAPGIVPGARVRQGEVIGYLGSSGLSSGPHLHFEVLVGNRWVDPLSIQVPREKRLTGRQLAAFQRERVRIEELMRQPPVRVSSLDQHR